MEVATVANFILLKQSTVLDPLHSFEQCGRSPKMKNQTNRFIPKQTPSSSDLALRWTAIGNGPRLGWAVPAGMTRSH